MKNKGITLVALVVTIIILLILTGVTLNLIIGDNALFEKVKKSTSLYKNASINEKEDIAKLENYLKENGLNNKRTVKSEKEKETVFKENTHIVDENDNTITIPGEFHIANDSGNTIDEGIVIEDNDGNQFVWIPVSNIDGNNDGKGKGLITKSNGEKIEITLGRYSDFSVGNPSPAQKGSDYSLSVGIPGVNPNYLCYETESYPNGGVPAKSIGDFVKSVEENHGFYIARYEASYASDNSPTGSYGNGVVTSIMTNQKPASKRTKRLASEGITNSSSSAIVKGQLWVYISQHDASKVSQNMYAGNKYVVSDLVNSFAWDTAIIYIQKILNIDYASKIDNNGTLHNAGDSLDEACKIFDIKGNVSELTTEWNNYNYASGSFPFTARGGSYSYSNSYTSVRIYCNWNMFDYYVGFRPLIYITTSN